MNWWQQALITFGAKSEGSSVTWNCLICKETFNSDEDIQIHLNEHNFEDFKALKFEVTVKGLKGDDWNTISQNTIDVAIDNKSKIGEQAVISENDEYSLINQDNQSLLGHDESTPFTRRLSHVRKRLSLEDQTDEIQKNKRAKQNEYVKNDTSKHTNNVSDVVSSEVVHGSQRLNKTVESLPTESNDEATNVDTLHVLIENRGTKALTSGVAEALSQNVISTNEIESNITSNGSQESTLENLTTSSQFQEIVNVNRVKTSLTTPSKNIRTFVKKIRSSKGKGPVYTCDACEYTSESHMLYHKHIVTHIEEKPILCWYCETQFEKTDTDGDVKTPVTCTRKRAKRKRMIVPRVTKSDESSEVVALDFTCFLCSYSFENNVALDQHLKCVHPDEIVNKTKEELENLKSSTKPGATAEMISAVAFYCHICHWKSDRHFNYHRHVLSHTIGKSFKCTYCSKVINTNNSKTGYGQIQHKCPECREEFHSKFKLNLHRFEVHAVKSAGSRQCSICGFICRTKKLIEKHHILAHGEEKFSHDDINIIQKEVVKEPKEPRQYTCEKCGFSAGRKDTMAKHALTHIPEEQRYLYCCIDCEYQTYAKSSLNMHVARKHRDQIISEGSPNMKCDICKKFTCTDKTRLIEHRNNCTTNSDAVKHELSGIIRKQSSDSRGNNITELSEKDQEPTVLVDAVMTPELGDTSGFLKNSSGKKKSNAKERTVYVCHECDLTFNRKWNLMRHKESAHKRAIYKCEFCDQHTKNFGVLHGHYLNVHMMEPPDYIKELMKEGTPKADEEKLKLRELTIRKSSRSQKRVECQFCGMLVSSYYLRTHLNNRHFNKKSFCCQHEGCDYHATTSGNLKSHVLRVHLNSSNKSSQMLEEDPAAFDNSLKQYMESMREILGNIDKGQMLEEENCLKQCTGCEYRTFSIPAMRSHQESGECPVNRTHQSSGSLADLDDSPKQLIIKQDDHMTSTPMQSITHVSKGFMNLISTKPGKGSSDKSTTAVLNEPPSYNEAVGKRGTAAIWTENPVVLIDGDNIIIKQENISMQDRVEIKNISNMEKVNPLIEEENNHENYGNCGAGNDMVSLALKHSSVDSGSVSEQSVSNGRSKDKENEILNNSAKSSNIESLSNIAEEIATFQNSDTTTYRTDDEDKHISQTPQFVIDKINDETTLITVQEGDVQTSYEIRGHLDVGPNGELPSDLYNFIADMLEKQSIEGQSEDVVYCDIVVND